MTSFKFPSAPAWVLALASAPWLLAIACSDTSDPNPSSDGGSGGTGGTTAAGGDGGNFGVSGGGGTGGSSGTGGSAGANNLAGSGGGMNPADAGPTPDAGGADASAQAFTLTSTAVDDVPGCGPADAAKVLCDLFPDENINLGDAANVSPEIHWTAAPAGTQSYTIALHDLSNLNGADPFTHWVMWNIPASATGLPAGLPGGANPGAPAPAGSEQVSYNGSGTNGGYVGSGACGNVYEFVLFALGTASIDPGSTNADAVEDAIAGSSEVLGTSTMRARSDPNGPTCN